MKSTLSRGINRAYPDCVLKFLWVHDFFRNPFLSACTGEEVLHSVISSEALRPFEDYQQLRDLVLEIVQPGNQKHLETLFAQSPSKKFKPLYQAILKAMPLMESAIPGLPRGTSIDPICYTDTRVFVTIQPVLSKAVISL